MRISPISIAFAALALAQSVLACDSDSTPIFDCQASNGHKFIELCSSPSVDANGYLQYRFGSLDKDGNEKAVEFEYPTNRSGSLKRFFAATYTHEGTYTQSVRFTTSNFSYSVFTQVHGKRDQGARVEVRNLSTGKTTVISCNERPRFYIFELKGLLACDPQTPLGKVCIE